MPQRKDLAKLGVIYSIFEERGNVGEVREKKNELVCSLYLNFVTVTVNKPVSTVSCWFWLHEKRPRLVLETQVQQYFVEPRDIYVCNSLWLVLKENSNKNVNLHGLLCLTYIYTCIYFDIAMVAAVGFEEIILRVTQEQDNTELRGKMETPVIRI